MLTLYRKTDCPRCDEVADELRELRLAHKVYHVEAGALEVGALEAGAGQPAKFPAGAAPPVLVDEGAIYVGSEAIIKHLADVARIKDRWQQHGSDACFCDPDGEIL